MDDSLNRISIRSLAVTDCTERNRDLVNEILAARSRSFKNGFLVLILIYPRTTMQRGFDKLANPAGMLLVVAFGLFLAGIIVVGARWVRKQEAKGKEERAKLRNKRDGSL